MKKLKHFVLFCLIAVLSAAMATGCNATGYRQDTPAAAAKAYAELRYTYQAEYADYACFKTSVTRDLIDWVMEENRALAEEYYSTVEVSSVVYTKNAELTAAEYNALPIQGSVTIAAAETGTLTYHLTLTCNESGKKINLPEQDRDYTEEITCIQVDGLWYIYVDVH